jgi:ribose transport system permease protein
LPPITAAFLGTSAIKLGRFNVVGTLVALYLLTVGITGLQLLGLQSWISDVFNGACLIFAVGFTILVRRGSTK